MCSILMLILVLMPVLVRSYLSQLSVSGLSLRFWSWFTSWSQFTSKHNLGLVLYWSWSYLESYSVMARSKNGQKREQARKAWGARQGARMACGTSERCQARTESGASRSRSSREQNRNESVRKQTEGVEIKRTYPGNQTGAFGARTSRNWAVGG